MALSLGIKRGEELFIGDTRYVLTDILSPHSFVLKCACVEFEISDAEAVEVEPEVWISAGRGGHYTLARVVIDAPRRIRILRGEHYHNGVS